MELPPVETKKRVALARKFAAALLLVFAIIVILADLLAPYDHTAQSRQATSAPPSTIRFRDRDGDLSRPFIYARRLVDPLTFRYEEVETEKYAIGLFVEGDPYHLVGLIPTSTHLFGVLSSDPFSPRLYLLGTDALGRDRFSRLLFAIRFSLLVCPIGAALACLIGILVGLVSGYAHRTIDTILMGAADSMLALPTLVLILAARAAFPLELPPLRAATLLIIIFALTGWAPMARLTRGVVRSLKQMDFVPAARSIGLSELRVLFRHILPNALPALATQALIILPYFLLSEVALSFLGVGLQEPEPSLGNMLAAASDMTQLARQPFLLLSPALAIFLLVLAVRLLSDEKQRGGDENIK